MKKRVVMGISSMLAAALLLCSCAAAEPEREDAEAGTNLRGCRNRIDKSRRRIS